MVANLESLTLAKSMSMNMPKLVAALNKGSGANCRCRAGEEHRKMCREGHGPRARTAQAAKVPVPLGGLVDQLVKGIN
jgi:hypothetical protein